MKKDIKKNLPVNTTPRTSYVKKAHAWCVTSWSEGKQIQKFFHDRELKFPIIFSDKRI